MTKQKQLVRTCLACGLEKPLAAFLQITGTQGTHYGNICSSCRSASAKGKVIIPPREEDTSRGSSGVRIGTKERVSIEVEQKSEFKKSQETHVDELEKREKTLQEKTELSDKKQKEEKKHREGFIDEKQKQAFLKYKSGTQVPIRKTTITPGEISIEAATAQQQQIAEAQNVEQAVTQEGRLSNIDTSQLFLDSQFGELKFQSVIWRQFKDWMGSGANFRMMERLTGAKPDNKPSFTKDIQNMTAKQEKSEKKIQGFSNAYIEHDNKTTKRSGPRSGG